jgi:hypothetical protein
VFLGADEASIRDSVAMGMAAQSTAKWSPTTAGTAEMFVKLSKETTTYRAMSAEARRMKAEKYFEEE